MTVSLHPEKDGLYGDDEQREAVLLKPYTGSNQMKNEHLIELSSNYSLLLWHLQGICFSFFFLPF
jgi:hypothetical protein